MKRWIGLVVLLLMASGLPAQEAACDLARTDDSLNLVLGAACQELEAHQALELDTRQRLEGILQRFDSIREVFESLYADSGPGCADSGPARELRSGNDLEIRLLGYLRQGSATYPGLSRLVTGLELSRQARQQLISSLLNPGGPQLDAGGRMIALELLRDEQVQELRDVWQVLKICRVAAPAGSDPALWGGAP